MPGKQDMRTPPWLFELLNKRFGPFDLDAAAEPHNALCEKYFTKEQDGLKQKWQGQVFCNPPFKNFGDWIQKAYEEWRGDTRTVLVGPVGCSQRWFHQYARQGGIYVPPRRVSFLLPDGTPTSGADRDTMIYTMGYPVYSKSDFNVFRLEEA